MEWEDGTDFKWSDVTGICGFLAGSCRAVGCGAGTWVKIFTQALGWHTVHKKCDPVLGRILWMRKSSGAPC